MSKHAVVLIGKTMHVFLGLVLAIWCLTLDLLTGGWGLTTAGAGAVAGLCFKLFQDGGEKNEPTHSERRFHTSLNTAWNKHNRLRVCLHLTPALLIATALTALWTPPLHTHLFLVWGLIVLVDITFNLTHPLWVKRWTQLRKTLIPPQQVEMAIVNALINAPNPNVELILDRITHLDEPSKRLQVLTLARHTHVLPGDASHVDINPINTLLAQSDGEEVIAHLKSRNGILLEGFPDRPTPFESRFLILRLAPMSAHTRWNLQNQKKQNPKHQNVLQTQTQNTKP